MGYAELIETLQNLPQDKRAEVFDFVEFLATKSGIVSSKRQEPEEWTDGEFAQLAMRQALRGMEDEAVSYTRDDIKERWQ
ncbi:MAG: DUF2281 domain-containing protein [Gallionella sp.]|nr:DUF2281 domain-containing protein [Gallionella sp.]